MQYLIDLHVHSKYSRATSKDLDVRTNAQWAKWKGIDVLGTGDFTHPEWTKEIEQELEDDPDHMGLLRLKDQEYRESLGGDSAPRFLLSVETSHIYSQGGKTRRVHIVTLAPTIEVVKKIQQELTKRKVNITSDGRPIMGLSCPDYMDIVMTIDERCFVFPAHIWTPWFAMFGSMSGFDSIEECFGSFSPFVYAVETGLSSEPLMNWRVADLDDRSIVSFSDAHSPSKLGREVTMLDGDLSYQGIVEAMGQPPQNDEPVAKIASTIEFFPEEGKYHHDGHRKCEVNQSPTDTKAKGLTCSTCGQPLTLGVLHRVEDLASRQATLEQMKVEQDEYGVRWIATPKGLKPPFTMMVPLQEIISEAVGVGVNSKTVQGKYQEIVQQFTSEFNFLLKTDITDIQEGLGNKFAEGIRRVRAGELQITPGYDGEFGIVKIYTEEEQKRTEDTTQQQLL